MVALAIYVYRELRAQFYSDLFKFDISIVQRLRRTLLFFQTQCMCVITSSANAVVMIITGTQVIDAVLFWFGI